jgi:hypothetical protein
MPDQHPQQAQVNFTAKDLVDIAKAIQEQAENRPCAMTLERMAIRLSDVAKAYSGQEEQK